MLAGALEGADVGSAARAREGTQTMAATANAPTDLRAPRISGVTIHNVHEFCDDLRSGVVLIGHRR